MALPATHYGHVIWVWMENHSYSSIIGSPDAPYINTLATDCGLATNYHNISHPSLPNYIAATSGLSPKQVKKFSSDCDPSSRCDTSSASIFSQASSWKAYEESMPSNCRSSNSGDYAVRHNPPPYYTKLAACASYDVPYSQLSTDLADNALPAFSFITPNVVDDMHDGTVAQGDAWLAANLPTIFNSTAFTTGTVVVFVTWDEGEGGASNNCSANTTDVGCHVATIVVSPSTPSGTTSAALFNHYSMLRTTEQLLGLLALGHAAHAASMETAFNL
jgi:phospholipase C